MEQIQYNDNDDQKNKLWSLNRYFNIKNAKILISYQENSKLVVYLLKII